MVGGKSVVGFLDGAACAGCVLELQQEAIPFSCVCFLSTLTRNSGSRDWAKENLWMQQQRGGPAKRGEEKLIKQRQEQQELD